MNKIPLIKPYLPEDVKDRVREVLDSGFLTEGPVTRELEDLCRLHIGCRHAIAVCNCTVGLEMALRAAGVGPGDEVIVPDYTYPATASVVRIVGATCVLVDVDPRTMLIDFAAMESAVTSRTKAVMPVSIFGNPLDYERLNAIKQKRGFLVIEDAACSIGAEYRGRKVGAWADISVFSFHPRKFITTGEGGLVTTDNPAWAEWMESYKHFGMASGPAAREGIVFEMAGTNFKLSNLQAAVGVGQMKRIDEMLERRRRLAARYRKLLDGCPGLSWPETVPGGVHSWQSFCVFVEKRDAIMRSLRAEGIEAQIGTYALHLHPAFAQSEGCRWSGTLEGSRRAFEQTLALPLYHDLSEEDQRRVATRLRALCEGNNA